MKDEMGIVGFGLGLPIAVEKNQKSPSFFAVSGIASSASFRWECIGSSSNLVDWRVSLSTVGGTQCVWKEGLFCWDGVKGSRWVFGRFACFSFCHYVLISRLFFPIKGTNRCSFQWSPSWGTWVGMEQVFWFRIVVFSDVEQVFWFRIVVFSDVGTFCFMCVAFFFCRFDCF